MISKRTLKESVELRNRLRMFAGPELPQWHPLHGSSFVPRGLSRADDGCAAFVAAGEALEGVLSGVGSFDVPASACLGRRLLTLVGDPAVQTALAEQGPCLVRVVVGVQRPLRCRWAAGPGQVRGTERSRSRVSVRRAWVVVRSVSIRRALGVLAERSCCGTVGLEVIPCFVGCDHGTAEAVGGQ